MPTTRIPALLRAAPVLLLAACAAGPNYQPPAGQVLKVPANFGASDRPIGTRGATTEPSVQSAEPVPAATAWWEGFRDPLLTEFVSTALDRNLDLEVAVARLRGSRAALRASRGVLFPSLNASASGNWRKEPNLAGTFDNYQGGIDASWEVDLFGGNRRGLEAARADAARSLATLGDVRRTVAAEAALAYFDTRTGQARLAVARSSLAHLDELVAITGWRYQAGLVTELDLEQARAQRAQVAASVPSLEQAVRVAGNRLAVLTAEAPGSADERLAEAKPLPIPVAVQPGLPMDLLRRRPDVVAAERGLAAETARLGVASANLLPALRLVGTLGSSADSFSGVGDVIVRSLQASVAAPLFRGGQLMARREQQQAAVDAALATYRGVVLRAIEEAETALLATQAAAERERHFLEAETAASHAAEMARSRYSAGLVDFQSVLEAERSLLNSQDGRIAAQAARVSAAIQLYKALGGDWTTGTERK